MRKLFFSFFLLLALGFIIPASASYVPSPYTPIIPNVLDTDTGTLIDFQGSGHLDYRTDHDYIITFVGIFQRPDSNTTFTITTYNGQTYNGEIGLQSTLIPGFYDAYIQFDGNIVTDSIFLFPYVNTEAEIGIWAVVNSTTNSTEKGFMITYGDLYIDTYGFEQYDVYSDPWGYVSITTTNPDIKTVAGVMDLQGYYDHAADSANNFQDEENIVWQIIGVFGTILSFVWEAYYWISLLVMNLPMFLAIAEMGTLFYSVASSSTIYTAIKKWIRFNVGVMDFFFGFFQKIIEMAKAVKETIPILRWL